MNTDLVSLSTQERSCIDCDYVQSFLVELTTENHRSDGESDNSQ